MKIVVIGGSGLIGTNVVEQAASNRATTSWRPRPSRASTPSPARDWPRRSRAPRSSSTWRTRRRAKTSRGAGVFRDLRAAICWPRKPPPASGIMSRCRSSAPSALPTAAISAPSWRRRDLIKASGHSLHDSARDAVLRVRRRHRPVGRHRRRRSGCRPPCSSPSPRTTSPPRWPISRWRAPVNGTVEVAGADAVPLDEIRAAVPGRQGRPAQGDRRRSRPLLRRRAQRSIADARGKARIGAVRFADWLSHASAKQVQVPAQ